MPATEVRKYSPADRGAVVEICYQTGFMGDSAERYWKHKPSFAEIWVAPYIEQEPESLYVAVKDGRVVGYLTGCLDTASGPKLEAVMMAAIAKHTLIFRPGTASFFLRAMLDSLRDKQKASGEFLDARWPAHLHINLLPEARGTGLGSALMDAWLEQVRQCGLPGCHLSTMLENTRAVAFFERKGFRKHGTPAPISGMRGENGERLHQQIMIWDA